MRRLVIAVALVAFGACTGDQANRSAEDAASETGEAVKGAEEGAAETVEKAADEADEAANDAAETAEQAVEDDKKAAAPAESDEAKAQNCLDLVDKSQFEEAVSACLKALDADPGNLEVQGALLKTQSATAGEGAGGEAKGAATGAVGDAMAAAETADKAAAPPDQLCLELVSNSQFEQAVPLCLKALDADPANTKVQGALVKAQSAMAG